MKALKAFIKHFEVPQRSVKIKIYVNFHFNTTFWNERGRKGYNRVFIWLFRISWYTSDNDPSLSKKEFSYVANQQ